MNLQTKKYPLQKRTVEFARLIRPRMMILPLIIYTSVLIINNGFSIRYFFLGWVLLLSTYGVAVIQNNISDTKIDKVNKRSDNPLATGSLNANDARRALMVSYVVGIIAAFLIQPLATLWFIVCVFLGWLYSGKFAFKNKGYLALLILAICYGIMPWVLSTIASGTTLHLKLVIIMLSSFLYVLGIISLKDFQDAKGDKKHSKMTVLVQKGSIFTQRFILFFTCVGYLVLLIFTIWQKYWLLALAIFLMTLLNAAILNNDKIITSSRFRGRYGKMLRASFFLYAIITYSI